MGTLLLQQDPGLFPLFSLSVLQLFIDVNHRKTDLLVRCNVHCWGILVKHLKICYPPEIQTQGWRMDSDLESSPDYHHRYSALFFAFPEVLIPQVPLIISSICVCNQIDREGTGVNSSSPISQERQ